MEGMVQIDASPLPVCRISLQFAVAFVCQFKELVSGKGYHGYLYQHSCEQNAGGGSVKA
jgi:hypothetical protein